MMCLGKVSSALDSQTSGILLGDKQHEVCLSPEDQSDVMVFLWTDQDNIVFRTKKLLYVHLLPFLMFTVMFGLD